MKYLSWLAYACSFIGFLSAKFLYKHYPIKVTYEMEMIKEGSVDAEKKEIVQKLT